MPLVSSLSLRTELPDKNAYFRLFESTGWNLEYGMSADDLYQAISNSWRFVSVYEDSQLVASGRIVSDGVFHALIVDVIVLPELQRRGVGTAIMQALIQECQQSRIRDVQLFCARGKASFYRQLGFRESDPEAPGMDYKG